MPETVQYQIDYLEVKVREIITLIDILKRTACIAELPHALADDLELRITINTNEQVAKTHEQALINIENYDISHLHHHHHHQ